MAGERGSRGNEGRRVKDGGRQASDESMGDQNVHGVMSNCQEGGKKWPR